MLLSQIQLFTKNQNKLHMKRLSMLVVLVALMGINAFAQTPQPTRTAEVKANLGLAKQSLMGSSERLEDCDTFANLCVDDTLVIYETAAGGYVAGQNGYGDISKADIFYLPGANNIKGALFYFGVGKAANSTDKFNVRCWDNDGTFGDGSPGGPGTVLGSKLVKYSDVAADVLADELTYVQFSPAISFPADSIFYIGIDFGYKAGDTIALVQVLERTGSCAGFLTAVEQWDPAYYGGGWWPYTTWGFTGTSNVILPIICNDVCEIDIAPASPEVCNKKPKTITASGATTYSWSPAIGLDCTTCAVVTYDYDTLAGTAITYTVTGDGGDCSGTVTVVTKNTPTSNFSIGACSAGARLLTRTGTPSVGVTYKWFRNGVKLTGSASTGATYLATISGNYKVKTTITETNCSKVSGEKTVTIDCKMGTSANFTAEAYPNPFTQSVTINMASGSSELATVRLVDLSGRTLQEYTGVDTSAPFEINENLTPGVYFVRVNQGANEKMIKIIKE